MLSEPYAPSRPARAQLQQLHQAGWTWPSLSEVTGMTPRSLSKVACGVYETMTAARADRIDAVFRALSGVKLPDPARPSSRRRELPPDPEDVATLRLRGLSDAEVAERLGCSLARVVWAEWLHALAVRNGQIVAAARDGVSLGELAAEHGLTRHYVGQIARGYYPVLGVDDFDDADDDELLAA